MEESLLDKAPSPHQVTSGRAKEIDILTPIAELLTKAPP
jgi:hypothetical protein